MLRLPWTKTTKLHGAKIMLCWQSAAYDPITALERHEALNREETNLPVFSYKTHNGPLCLTKYKFLQRCNEIWLDNGLPTMSGHSFRIGGTTELLVAGVPPDVVKMMGRWSSDAFLTYWRSLELIAPQHAELLTDVS
jgi:hypothetical protein